MKTGYKFVAGGLVAAAVIGIAVYQIASRKAAADPRRVNVALVKVEQPQRQDIVQHVTLTGDVLPIQQAQIFAKVYSNLDRVLVNIGDHVRAGQLLAVIDTTELIQQAQQAQATYQNAKALYDRQKDLLDRNLAAKQDVDNAQTAMTVAEANYTLAKTRLGYAQITAPFSGIITKRYLDAGALVSSNNTTLFTLADLERVKIIVNILEKDVPLVSIGTKATVTVDALPGKELTGTVARTSQSIDLNTRTMAVEIDLPNEDHLLKPGMFATVSLIVAEHPQVLTVPTMALQKDDKGYFLYLADQNTAHRRDITIGAEQQSRTEVLSGLTGPESVITTGQQFVKDGGSVKVMP